MLERHGECHRQNDSSTEARVPESAMLTRANVYYVDNNAMEFRTSGTCLRGRLDQNLSSAINRAGIYPMCEPSAM